MLVAVSKIAGEVGGRDPGVPAARLLKVGEISWKLPGERRNTALG